MPATTNANTAITDPADRMLLCPLIPHLLVFPPPYAQACPRSCPQGNYALSQHLTIAENSSLTQAVKRSKINPFYYGKIGHPALSEYVGNQRRAWFIDCAPLGNHGADRHQARPSL